MKKIFGISLFALLAISPIMTKAEVVAGDPGATTSGAAAASATPKYALKNSAGTDGNAATAGYVKGAYNAIIKGINATQGEIDTINTNIGTYENTVSHLLDNAATKTGTEATVNAATSTEQIASSSVNITGVTTSSISATASGNVNLSVPVMDNWATDGEATNPVQTTTSFSGLAVNGLAMSAPGTSNTASVTKSGISGTVNLASAGFDFTKVDIDAWGEDLTSDDDAMTWSTTFPYGTVSGTALCSSTDSGTPDETDGDYCWCKMTGFEDSDGITYNQSSAWFYLDDMACSDNLCANACSIGMADMSTMRSAMFGSVQ